MPGSHCHRLCNFPPLQRRIPCLLQVTPHNQCPSPLQLLHRDTPLYSVQDGVVLERLDEVQRRFEESNVGICYCRPSSKTCVVLACSSYMVKDRLLFLSSGDCEA